MLYDLIPVFLGIIIAGLGAFMALFPRISTKKERRDDPNAVAKNRISGIVMIIFGILLAVFRIILFLR